MNDPDGIELDIGTTNNWNPVKLNVIDLDVVAIIAIVSKDLKL